MLLVPDGRTFVKHPKSDPYGIFNFNFAQGFFFFKAVREMSTTRLLIVYDFEISEF